MTTDRYEQHLSSGGELLRQGRLADAVRELQAATALRPRAGKALALLGLAHFRGGQFREAREIYERLVAASPGNGAHLLNLGLVHLKLGDAEAAIGALERSRAIDPNPDRAIGYLGLAYARAGRFAAAYEAFLIAGQTDLADEIAENLGADQRAAIEAAAGAARSARGADPRAEPTAPSSTTAATAAGTEDAEADGTPSRDIARAAAEIVILGPSGAPAAAMAPSVTAAAEPPRSPRDSDAAALLDLGDDGWDLALQSIDDEASKRDSAARSADREAGADADDGTSMRATAGRSADREAWAEIDDEAAVRDPAGPAADGVAAADNDDAASKRATAAGAADREAWADVDDAALKRATAAGAADREAWADVDDAASKRDRAGPAATRGAGPADRASGVQTLAELATARLLRPEADRQPLSLGPDGALIVRVSDRMIARVDGVCATGGRFGFQPATRRARGQNGDEPFETDGRPMFVISGAGYLIAAPTRGRFTVVSLDEDIVYLREELLFAFEPDLRWENGYVPGMGRRRPMVQFRGTGSLAFQSQAPLRTIKLAPDHVLHVDTAALAGWIGRVVPRAVTARDVRPDPRLVVECSGEGVVLLHGDVPPAGVGPG